MTFGSIRHHVRIDRDADDIWELVGDPGRLHEWFPGMTASAVDGAQRVVTLGSGVSMPEEILVNDSVQRRFQYRLAVPVVAYHRGSIDVLDLGDHTSVVVYTTDCDPRTMALTIGGATAGALDELKRRMETEREVSA